VEAEAKPVGHAVIFAAPETGPDAVVDDMDQHGAEPERPGPEEAPR
jgi:hypothetical protein